MKLLTLYTIYSVFVMLFVFVLPTLYPNSFFAAVVAVIALVVFTLLISRELDKRS